MSSGSLRFEDSSGLVLRLELHQGVFGLPMDEETLEILETAGMPQITYEGYTVSIHDETP